MKCEKRQCSVFKPFPNSLACTNCGTLVFDEIVPLQYTAKGEKMVTKPQVVKQEYSIVKRRNDCLLFIKRYFETVKAMLESGHSWRQIDEHYGNRKTCMDVATFRKYYREEYERQYGVSVQDQKRSGGFASCNAHRVGVKNGI